MRVNNFSRVLAAALTLGLLVTTADSFAKDFDFGAYFRAGTGMNALGGRQSCVTNSGSLGNEFRLGNECSYYSEISFKTNLLGSQTKDPTHEFFRTQVTLALSPPDNTQYESSSSGLPNSSYVNVIEGFAEGGNFDDVKMTYWAGKRFYRNTDVHMNDFFYYANMSGIGGGVGDIQTGIGFFKAAILQETPTVNVTSTGSTTALPVYTSSGQISKQALDLRLEAVPLTAIDSLNFWGAAARENGGSSRGTANTGTPYLTGGGWAAGMRYRHTLPKGFNDLAAIYGEGVMQTLDMTAPLITQGNIGNSNTWRLRLVDNLATEINDRWATQFATTFESRRAATALNAHSNWFNIGVRPTYYMTDHFHLTTQLGYSLVKDEADQVGGNPLGSRNMIRATIAPEVNLSRDFFGRPVIRFYVTWSHWNQNNQSFIAANAPEFSDKLSGVFYGFQTEFWY
jgi:maltoporin